MDGRALERRLRMIERRIERVLQVGAVVEADSEGARVKVRVRDSDADTDRITRWVPWLTRRAGGDTEWWAPEVGEQVLLLAPNGMEAAAVCMSALYSSAHPAPESSAERHVVAYGDGSTVTYDREAGEMVLDLVGDLKISAAGNVKITGNRIDLN